MEWPSKSNEAERLRALAEWYRGWALVAGNATVRAARFGLAERIEAQVRALAERRSATG
jgi:hypothetical protein